MTLRLPPPPARAAAPSRAPPLAVFTVVATAIAVAGLLVHRAAEREFREDRATELAAVVSLKAQQVVRWRDERLADAAALATDPVLAGSLALPPESPDAAAELGELGAWFEGLRGIGDLTGVALLDRAGRLRAVAGPLAVDVETVRPLVERALAEDRPLMSDVLHGAGGTPRVHVVAPVLRRGEPTGAVLLRVDPRPYLFRVVESWHEPSESAEVLLVHADEGALVSLNEPRGDGPVRLPSETLPAVPPVPAAFQARDDRGVPVIGAAAPVRGTPWAVVAKEDAADTLSPLRERAATLGVATLALLLAAGAGAISWWRAQAARADRARLVGEAERRVLFERLHRLTRHAQDMVLLADEDQRLVEVNDRAVALLGYPREELVGKHVRELRDPATLGDFSQRVQQQITQGAALFATRYRRKDGSTFPVELSVHSTVYEGRRWFEAIARDVSDRQRAEEALRASEAKFRAAFEFAGLGVLLVDPAGRILESNRAFRAMLGYGEDELRDASLADVIDPADGEPARAELAEMLQGTRDALEAPRRHRHKDGGVVDTVVRARAIRDDAGRFLYSLGVVEDVSEKKRVEAQLLLADRMASVGTLAAGVAHEINNPLSFILSNVEFALAEARRAGLDAEVLRALEDARDGGARVREIVRDLKAFSRADDDLRDTVDVRRVLQSAIGLASNELRHRAELVVDPGEVPPVAASEHRLGQVCLNLLINAAQAIPEGRAAENVVRVATFTAPDGSAVLEVSDTGVGIPPDVVPRIFDPFFTTKPIGVGTGLGLAICHGIVAQLGGRITVDTAPGKGTTFRVSLPPAGARRAADVPRAAPLPAPRRGRILVVDDEALVGRAVSRILAPEHEVVTHTSALAALEEVLAGRPGAFDVLLCDLMMPEMNGMQLHARLLEAAPWLAARTVFLTGGAFTPAASEFLEHVPNARVDKPFEPQTLRDAVARVLGGRAAAPVAS